MNHRHALATFVPTALLCALTIGGEPTASIHVAAKPIAPIHIGDAPRVMQQLPDGLVFKGDVVCGAGENAKYQKLDILYHEDRSVKRPAIFFIHGGGWWTGNKRGHWCPELMKMFALHGYVTLSVDYRLSDIAPFPAQVADCKLAVRWLRAHADEYGVDPQRIGAAGISAGGHLSAMLATADPSQGLEGDGPYRDQSSRLQAAVPVGGGYEFRPDRVDQDAYKVLIDVGFRFKPLLGGTIHEKPELATKASPIAFVTEDDPPMLVIHGTGDPTIPQALDFAEVLKQTSEKHESLILEGASHVDSWRWIVTGQGPAQERVKAFFDRHLKGPDSPRE